jgi:hypothetical protein
VGAHHLGGVVAEVVAEMLAILKRVAAHEYIMEREFGYTFAAEVRRVIKKAEGDA